MDDYKRIVVDGIRYYGKHLILSACACDDTLLEKDAIAQFMRTLVEEIDMTPFGDPIVERFGQGIETGISAVQLIETSAITIHTNDAAKDLYLDVFSCKGFNENTVVQVMRDTFNPNSFNFQVFLRA